MILFIFSSLGDIWRNVSLVEDMFNKLSVESVSGFIENNIKPFLVSKDVTWKYKPGKAKELPFVFSLIHDTIISTTKYCC